MLEGKIIPYNPINEIRFLRNNESFLVDTKNKNRYRIMVKDGLKHTAYCFGTPIYNINSRKLVNLVFENMKNGYIFRGTNATVTVCGHRCVLENKEGKTILLLDDSPNIYGYESNNRKQLTAIPTMNGLRFVVNGSSMKFTMNVKCDQHGIRFNSGCFSIMKEEFRPFMSIATMYASDGNGTYAPVEMRYLEKAAQCYEIEIFHGLRGGSFMFEVNLYEPKLFQDTTVESLHPDKNNAFGSVGFIGKTAQYGEQWLYSRPDFSKIPDLSSDRIEQVLLHIPILNRSVENIDVYIPQKRFCSFGSTWNKRINGSGKVASSNNRGRYLSIDVTSMFTDKFDQTLTYNEGLILKKPKGKNNFITISTGDCYSAPQILEIKFKK